MHCIACSNPELKSSVEELKQKTENLVERCGALYAAAEAVCGSGAR
jgi:hypothetical protein